jgi:hypothetical protein
MKVKYWSDMKPGYPLKFSFSKKLTDPFSNRTSSLRLGDQVLKVNGPSAQIANQINGGPAG